MELSEINVDGCSLHFFHALATSTKSILLRDDCSTSGLARSVRIPHTVYVEHGVPRFWFRNAPDGVVVKLIGGKDFSRKELERVLVDEPLPGCRSAASSAEIVAVLYSLPPLSYEEHVSDSAAPHTKKQRHVTRTRYLTRDGVRQFFDGSLSKHNVSPSATIAADVFRRCMLQQFEPPQGWYNTMIRAVWSPKVCMVDAVRSATSMKDTWKSLSDIGATFEASASSSVKIELPECVVDGIKNTSRFVAECLVVGATDDANLTTACVRGMLLYFKVNCRRELVLLYSGSLRVVVQQTAAALSVEEANLEPFSGAQQQSTAGWNKLMEDVLSVVRQGKNEEEAVGAHVDHKLLTKRLLEGGASPLRTTMSVSPARSQQQRIRDDAIRGERPLNIWHTMRTLEQEIEKLDFDKKFEPRNRPTAPPRLLRSLSSQRFEPIVPLARPISPMNAFLQRVEKRQQQAAEKASDEDPLRWRVQHSHAVSPSGRRFYDDVEAHGKRAQCLAPLPERSHYLKSQHVSRAVQSFVVEDDDSIEKCSKLRQKHHIRLAPLVGATRGGSTTTPSPLPMSRWPPEQDTLRSAPLLDLPTPPLFLLPRDDAKRLAATRFDAEADEGHQESQHIIPAKKEADSNLPCSRLPLVPASPTAAAMVTLPELNSDTDVACADDMLVAHKYSSASPAKPSKSTKAAQQRFAKAISAQREQQKNTPGVAAPRVHRSKGSISSSPYAVPRASGARSTSTAVVLSPITRELTEGPDIQYPVHFSPLERSPAGREKSPQPHKKSAGTASPYSLLRCGSPIASSPVCSPRRRPLLEAISDLLYCISGVLPHIRQTPATFQYDCDLVPQHVLAEVLERLDPIIVEPPPDVTDGAPLVAVTSQEVRLAASHALVERSVAAAVAHVAGDVSLPVSHQEPPAFVEPIVEINEERCGQRALASQRFGEISLGPAFIALPLADARRELLVCEHKLRSLRRVASRELRPSQQLRPLDDLPELDFL